MGYGGVESGPVVTMVYPGPRMSYYRKKEYSVGCARSDIPDLHLGLPVTAECDIALSWPQAGCCCDAWP